MRLANVSNVRKQYTFTITLQKYKINDGQYNCTSTVGVSA